MNDLIIDYPAGDVSLTGVIVSGALKNAVDDILWGHFREAVTALSTDKTYRRLLTGRKHVIVAFIAGIKSAEGGKRPDDIVSSLLPVCIMALISDTYG